MYTLSSYLDSGYTFYQLVDTILGHFNRGNRFQTVADIKSSLPNAKDRNLIRQGIIYYHKELRVKPKPSVTAIDYDTGSMVSSGQEFFVEMVASYTMQELIEYLLSFGYIDTREYPTKRLSGLINFYLNKYDIDMVLFMMEAVSNHFDSEGSFSFDKFDSYYSIAKGYLDNIKNNCRTTGGDKIVARKRLLFS